MTIRIMPEFDREGWSVCLFWLQDSKYDEAPTDKKSLSSVCGHVVTLRTEVSEVEGHEGTSVGPSSCLHHCLSTLLKKNIKVATA